MTPSEEDLKLEMLSQHLAEVADKCLAVARLYAESGEYLEKLRAVVAASRAVVRLSTPEAYPGQEIDILQVLPALETALSALDMSGKDND